MFTNQEYHEIIYYFPWLFMKAIMKLKVHRTDQGRQHRGQVASSLPQVDSWHPIFSLEPTKSIEPNTQTTKSHRIAGSNSALGMMLGLHMEVPGLVSGIPYLALSGVIGFAESGITCGFHRVCYHPKFTEMQINVYSAM